MLAQRLGATVRRPRMERGYSQAALANMCKIEWAHMGVIERGEVNVTVMTAFKITRALEIDLLTLFGEVEQESLSPD